MSGNPGGSAHRRSAAPTRLLTFRGGDFLNDFSWQQLGGNAERKVAAEVNSAAPATLR